MELQTGNSSNSMQTDTVVKVESSFNMGFIRPMNHDDKLVHINTCNDAEVCEVWVKKKYKPRPYNTETESNDNFVIAKDQEGVSNERIEVKIDGKLLDLQQNEEVSVSEEKANNTDGDYVEGKSADEDEALLEDADHDGDEVNVEIGKNALKVNVGLIMGLVVAKHLGYLESHNSAGVLVTAFSAATGFVACSTSLRLRVTNKRASKIFDKVGSAATSIAVTSLTSMFLPSKYIWVPLLGVSVSILCHWLF